MNNNKYTKKELSVTINPEGLIIPQSPDLEQVILGSVLLEKNALGEILADFSPNLFYDQKNKIIAESILELYLNGTAIDIVTITQHLKNSNKLDDVGGAYYISTLTNRVGSASNLEYHLRLLQQDVLARNIINVCSSAVYRAYKKDEDIFDLYQNIQLDLDSSLKSVIRYTVKTIKDVHFDIIQESIEVHKKGTKSGIPTGLRMLDNVTNGWQKSDLIILAGRPSMGKTAAAVSMITYPALDNDIPVGIFSLEMSAQQLVSRVQSGISGINVSRIVKKQLDAADIQKIAMDCAILEKAPIYIDDTPNISLLELKGKARKLVRENGVKLIIIDYLQLMRSGLNIMNREQEIAEISRGLKGIAKELEIPVIALSQLSRGVESRQDKKPMLSDLRESGQIEQDADMVIFCYRPEYYGIEQYEIGGDTFDTNGLFMFIISKHRNGELGEIPLKFLHEQTKIINHNDYLADNNSTFVQQEHSYSPSSGLQENRSFLDKDNTIVTNNDDLPF
jgi:replicative DNA helicase